MARNLEDLTGQKFSRLYVIGEGEILRKKNGTIKLWDLQCDCGKRLSLPRTAFTRKKWPQRSCGCLRREGFDNNRRPYDLRGKKFGLLTPLEIIPGVKKYNSSMWRCRCDCGAITEQCAKDLLNSVRNNKYRITCGDRSKHRAGLWYPETPSPLPEETGELIAKYLHMVRPQGQSVDAAVEDERMERLIRVCWIVCYRRQQGEIISEEYERQYIRKHLRFAGAIVKRRRYEESGGCVRYNSKQYLRIGNVMTKANIISEAVVPLGQTQPEVILPKRRKFKFKRC